MTICNRGYVWEHKKEYDNALADFNEAIRLDAGDADAFGKRGESGPSRKSYARALADYYDTIRLDPKHVGVPQPSLDMGHVPRCQVSRWSKGSQIGHYRLQPKRMEGARIIVMLAAAYAEIGEFQKAVEYCGKSAVLKADPTVQIQLESLLCDVQGQPALSR